MMNPFVIKKYLVLVLMPIINLIFFVIGNIFYGFWGGVVFFFVGIMLTMLLSNLLLKNPFSVMLEGKGLLLLDINSTGIIRPFICAIDPPYIIGKVGKHSVKDIFNRKTVLNLATPEEIKEAKIKRNQDGGVFLNIDEEEYNKGRFGLFHFPVLIYNSQLKSIITKDWLSENEKSDFAEHTVLYLGKVLEDLNKNTRDFGRYVVETLKPAGSWFKENKWIMWVVIIGCIILLALFAKPILNMLTSAGGTLSNAASSTQTITPR